MWCRDSNPQPSEHEPPPAQSQNQFTYPNWLQSISTCHPTFTDKKVCQPAVAIQLANSWSQKCDNFPASFTDQVWLGYLDVAIEKKICKTCMPSCAIDSRQRLFRCSHCEKNAKLECHLVLQIHDRGYLDVAIAKKLSVKLAKKFKNLSVKLAKNGRENISSVKVGVHRYQKVP